MLRLFLSLSGLCLLTVLGHPDYSDSWQEFKTKYSKEYTSQEEEDYRQGVWSGNVDKIISHNLDTQNGLYLYSLGENEYADLTSDEIITYMNGFDSQRRPPVEGKKLAVSTDDLPESVDWTKNKTVVTPVKNQAMCGSCWAFSATGSLEGQHAIKTGKLVSLSEQNLVDCSRKEGNLGCFGGLMDKAFAYVKDNGGIDTEESYPYTAKMGTKCLYNSSNSGATLQSWVDVKKGDETELQKAVATIGPISVAMDAHLPSFHFYKKGLYHDKNCSSIHLDHGVLAVGYGAGHHGDDGKAKDYWIVKNSWGTSWGMQGYFHLARNMDNQCGVATAASYPVV